MSGIENTIQRIADALRPLEFVRAVVLGGSRATGTAGAESDLDIGVYYDHERLDLAALNGIVGALDDEGRSDMVCPEGGWGPWVNCGAWLCVDGVATDLILRDVARVEKAIEDTDRGEITANYHPGHPHAYLNVMYRGELALCRVLWAREGFAGMQARAQEYPEKMRQKLLEMFRFETGFALGIAEKSLRSGDPGYVAGNLYRAAACMNQALFAWNRAYCLNEKKAARRVETLAVHPENYAARMAEIFEGPTAEGVALMKALAAEADEICGR